MDIEISVHLAKKQLKIAVDSYPALSKKVYPGILVRGLRVSFVPSLNSNELVYVIFYNFSSFEKNDTNSC